MPTDRGDGGNHTPRLRLQKQQNGACCGDLKMPLQITLWSCHKHKLSSEEDSKVKPEHGAVQEHSSASSRYHKSLVYSAVRRREHLNTLVLKFHTAEGPLFHSAFTSSVQLDCFAFSIQPHSSERVHILKCREM